MSKLSEFIYNQKIFSKCSKTEQEEIKEELEKHEKLIFKFEEDDHDLDWYKHEYYSMCDRIEILERVLDKSCDELSKKTISKNELHFLISG